VLAPVYISEIAPADRRGALTGLFQFNIVLGILLAFLSNALVQMASGGDDLWRLKLGIAAAPAILFAILMFTIPQSPRWLCTRGRLDEARASLQRVGVTNPDAMLAEFARSAEEACRNAAERLFVGRYRLPILLAVLLALFNQLSGINGILYYLNDTLKAAGIEGMSNAWQSVAIGAANFISTLIALRFIDRVGRKKLLLIGSVGTAVALATAAMIFSTGQGGQYFSTVLIVFIAFFAFSQGAVIWVYLAEIFPTAVRSRGQALGSATHWAMAAVISMVYPMLSDISNALPFAIFAGCMGLQFFVVLMIFPETRGVELESMDKALQSKSGASA
jgi:sugar porter (SP) family MFS transporter